MHKLLRFLGRVSAIPLWTAGGLAIFALPLTVVHAQERCEGMPVDVVAGSADERNVVCSAADDALRLLGQCGIDPRRPLRIEIAAEAQHPLSKRAIFGFFDTKLDTVHVAQETRMPSLVAGTPYSTLPSRNFYRSLIVHEVVHGVMHQHFKRVPASHAAYEYPAYALQIASLPADVRTAFLQAIPDSANTSEWVFNDIVLLFDPYFFAARAYAHFSKTDGCTHLTALLQGEVAFIPTLPP